MTKYQFNKAVQERYKASLELLIQNIRMQKAHEMVLKRRELDLEDIAFDLGYSSLASFSRSFKEYYKITPSDLRKNRSRNNYLFMLA